jgi:hypothetical protein
MKTDTLRERLHKQIDRLPDELVEQISDFALFLTVKSKVAPKYEDWDDRQWQALSLEQFFREDDDVVYTLKDAREIYKP